MQVPHPVPTTRALPRGPCQALWGSATVSGRAAPRLTGKRASARCTWRFLAFACAAAASLVRSIADRRPVMSAGAVWRTSGGRLLVSTPPAGTAACCTPHSLLDRRCECRRQARLAAPALLIYKACVRMRRRFRMSRPDAVSARPKLLRRGPRQPAGWRQERPPRRPQLHPAMSLAPSPRKPWWSSRSATCRCQQGMGWWLWVRPRSLAAGTRCAGWLCSGARATAGAPGRSWQRGTPPASRWGEGVCLVMLCGLAVRRAGTALCIALCVVLACCVECAAGGVRRALRQLLPQQAGRQAGLHDTHLPASAPAAGEGGRGRGRGVGARRRPGGDTPCSWRAGQRGSLPSQLLVRQHLGHHGGAGGRPCAAAAGRRAWQGALRLACWCEAGV